MSSTDLLAEVNEILDNLELRSTNESHVESHGSLPPSPPSPAAETVPPPPKPHLQLPQIVSARSTASQPAVPRFVSDLPPAVPMEHSCWRITPASVTFDMSAASTVTIRVTNTHTHQLRAAIVPAPLPPCLSRSGAPSALVSPGISFTQTITYTPAVTQATPINTTLTFRCQSSSSPTPFVLALPLRILPRAAAAAADDLAVTRHPRDARAAARPGSDVRAAVPATLPPLTQRVSSVSAPSSAFVAMAHPASATDAVVAPPPASSPSSPPTPTLPPSRARTPSSPALDAALLWPTDEIPAPPPLLPLAPASSSPEPSPESSPVVLAAPPGRILAHSPSLEASNAFISSLATHSTAPLSPALARPLSPHSSHSSHAAQTAQSSSFSFELVAAAPHPAPARSPAWSPAHAATPLSHSSSRASSRAASRTPSRHPARQPHSSASTSTSTSTTTTTSASGSSPHTNPFNERWQQRQHTAAAMVSLARTVASAASLRRALQTLHAALPALLPLMAPPDAHTHAQTSPSPSPSSSHAHARGMGALPPSRSSSRVTASATAHAHIPSRAPSSSSRHTRDLATTTTAHGRTPTPAAASAPALAAADAADIFARAVLPQPLHSALPHPSPTATLAATAHAPSSLSVAAASARTPSRALAATSHTHPAATAPVQAATAPLSPTTFTAATSAAATRIAPHAPAAAPPSALVSAPTPSADTSTDSSPALLDAMSALPPFPRAPTPLAVRDPARFLTLPLSPAAPPPAPAAASTCPLPPTPCLPLPACAPATDALSAFLAAELGCSLPAQLSLDCLPATVPLYEDMAALGPLADCLPSLAIGAHAPTHLLCGLPPAPVPAPTDYAALLAPQPAATPSGSPGAYARVPAPSNASPLAPRSVAVLPSLTPALLAPHTYPQTPLDLVADTASLANSRPPPSSAAEQPRPLVQPLPAPDRHAVLFHSQYASATLPPPSFAARPPAALPTLAAQIAPPPPRTAQEPSLFPVHVWRADTAAPQPTRTPVHHSGSIASVAARPTAHSLFLSSITPEDDHTLAVTPAPSALPRVPVDAPLAGQLALVLGPTSTTLAPEPMPIPPAILTAPGAPYNPALAAAPGLASALALVPALRYSLGFGGAVPAVGVSGLLSTLQTGNVSNQF